MPRSLVPSLPFNVVNPSLTASSGKQPPVFTLNPDSSIAAKIAELQLKRYANQLGYYLKP